MDLRGEQLPVSSRSESSDEVKVLTRLLGPSHNTAAWSFASPFVATSTDIIIWSSAPPCDVKFKLATFFGSISPTSRSSPSAPPCNPSPTSVFDTTLACLCTPAVGLQSKRRPENGWMWDDACNEKTGWVTWVVLDWIVDASDADCELRERTWLGTGRTNLRAIKLFICLNGMYFGKFGSTRRFWCKKIIQGEHPEIIIWFPRDTALNDEKKWWGEDGTCQQSWKQNRIDLPLMKTRTCTSPMPSMTILVPRIVWWSLHEGAYVENKERSWKICDGRMVSTTR